MFRQLVSQLARHVELAVRYSLTKGKLTPQSLLTSASDLQDLMDKPLQLDHQLLRYVESGRDATQDLCHLSYMHDKGNVAGLQLQTAVFVTPSNMGVVACPTVVGAA